MSHIFISYSHADKPYLDKLVAWLGENEIASHQLWYDQHIEGGNNWRDEITNALDEAFAVFVIVTKNSAKSLYCTYEWAYAMGQGIPILPLVFDEVSLADAPAPLASKEFINCKEGIPDFLRRRIDQLRSVPPQVAAINKIIFEAIYDTHRRFFILKWTGKELRALEDEFCKHLLTYFMRKASEAHQTLQTLMVDKAFVFSGRQYRFCWQVTDILEKFSHLQPEYENYLPEYFCSLFDTEWLPAFEYFEGSGWWSQCIRKYFERNLADNNTKMQVLAEMMRAFPIFIVPDAEILIENKHLDQQNTKHEV